jgi:hypothetical protein
MKVHVNAVLGPAGRLALVQAIESGATAHRWWHRRLDASAEECGQDTGCSIAPLVPTAARGCSMAIPKERICEWRRRTGW